MIVSSFQGHLLDLEKTLDIIQHKDFERNRVGIYKTVYGWLRGNPLVIRCMLKDWQELESEYLS